MPAPVRERHRVPRWLCNYCCGTPFAPSPFEPHFHLPHSRRRVMKTASKPLLALTARDLMTTDVVSVPQEMSLQGAARLLSRASISGAPVVDADGRCVGVLSATDFMVWAENSDG